MFSLYKQHCEKWEDGCGAQICDGAKNKCFARGTIPCQCLFIGEAPGKGENTLGLPFIGVAGKLLDRIIRRAIPHYQVKDHDDTSKNQFIPETSYAFTNIVACIPFDVDGEKEEPYDEDVRACAPRLQEFIKISDPQLIVCVGRVAWGWLESGYKDRIKFHREIPMIEIQHPASILRKPIAQQGLDVQRCVVQVRNAVGKYCVE